MKKLICALGMVSFLSLGITENATAQTFGGGRQVSARAKGAIIGGGLGAAAGAIIHRRDPVAGGIIGAVLGAGGGYMIGNNEDKIRERRAYQATTGSREFTTMVINKEGAEQAPFLCISENQS